MKKFIAIAICAVLLGTFALTASAEGDILETTDPTASEAVQTESVETEPVESASEIETSNSAEEPTDEPPVTDPGEVDNSDPNKIEFDFSAQGIVNFIKSHLDTITAIITMIGTTLVYIKKHGILNKTMTTMNNNTVAVSENSVATIKESLVNMQSMTNIVMGYKDEIAKLLEEVRQNADERAKLESSLAEVSDYLKATRMANVELANEVAELLVLANIPNSKKDELYARHLKAIEAIAEAEKSVEQATQTMEVKDNEEGNQA